MVETNDPSQKNIAPTNASISSLYKQFQLEPNLTCIDKEQDRRIDVLHQLFNDLLDSQEHDNGHLEVKEYDPVYDAIQRLYSILPSGHPNTSPTLIRPVDQKSKHDWHKWTSQWEEGMMLLHCLLHRVSTSDINTTQTPPPPTTCIIPSHLVLWEIVNNTARQYDLFTSKRGCYKSILILLIFSYGLEYLVRETKEKLESKTPIRWKRIQSLISDSFRTIQTMLETVHISNEKYHDDDDDDDDDNDNEAKKDISPSDSQRIHPCILFSVKQYLLPAILSLISIHEDPVDVVLDGIGLISFLLPLCTTQSSGTILMTDLELCQWIIALQSTTITNASLSSASTTSILTLDHILTHPLRSMTIAAHHKQCQLKQKRQAPQKKQEEIFDDISSDDDGEENSNSCQPYSKNDFLNKLAQLTDKKCTMFLPWNDQGIALFAYTLLSHHHHQQQSLSYRSKTNSTIKIDNVSLPAIYSPSYSFLLSFPHTCTLFLSCSTNVALQYLSLTLQYIPPPKIFYNSCNIPKRSIVNTCQLLLNTQRKEGIQILQIVLTQYTNPSSKSIDCIHSLIRNCPYPNAIPILLDLLRKFISESDDNGESTKYKRTIYKSMTKIIRPFVLEMRNYDGDHEHILQMYEIYACVLILLRRMLMQERQSSEREQTQAYESLVDLDQIKSSWSTAKIFQNRIEMESSEFGENQFRLFLLQDALSQFINEGNFHFMK